MSLQEEIVVLTSELELFDDVMDKYEYIIDLGKSLKGLDDVYKTEAYRVLGCQSQVWLRPIYKDGKIFFEADGDALIVRGLVQILLRIYSGRTKEEILESKKEDLLPLGLHEIISSGRQNGIASMLEYIYEYAQKESHEK